MFELDLFVPWNQTIKILTDDLAGRPVFPSWIKKFKQRQAICLNYHIVTAD
jgi:hypothetical protein